MHEQAISPSALDPQGAQERAGGQQDEGQQMPNGTAGATSSVTAKDVATDGSQRIRSGIGDQGGDRVPAFAAARKGSTAQQQLLLPE